MCNRVQCRKQFAMQTLQLSSWTIDRVQPIIQRWQSTKPTARLLPRSRTSSLKLSQRLAKMLSSSTSRSTSALSRAISDLVQLPTKSHWRSSQSMSGQCHQRFPPRTDRFQKQSCEAFLLQKRCVCWLDSKRGLVRISMLQFGQLHTVVETHRGLSFRWLKEKSMSLSVSLPSLLPFISWIKKWHSCQERHLRRI